MAKVKFTSALQRFFPGLEGAYFEGDSVQSIIQSIEVRYPGIQHYLLEEDGKLRRHVNIFLDNEMILYRNQLSDPVTDSDEILIFQALSGG